MQQVSQKDPVPAGPAPANDIEMLEYAGLAIAMGNASEEVKTIADIVTDTNENNGVIKAIDKLIQ